MGTRLSHIGLFLISPFLSLVEALRNFQQPSTKNIIWAFTAFYGFTFVIGSSEVDSYRYAEMLKEVHQHRHSLNAMIDATLRSDEKLVDYFQTGLTIFVGIFTDNPFFLFGSLGIVFGFFYSRNLWYVFNRLDGRVSGLVKFYLFALSLTIPIWFINGFRMWTAAHIYIFGLLPFLIEGKKKYLFVSFLSVFVHFSFYFPMVLLIIYTICRYIKVPLWVFFGFFIGTFFMYQLDIQFVTEILKNYLPDLFQDRVKNYTSKAYIKVRSEMTANANWYVLFYTLAIKWFIAIYFILIYTRGKKLLNENPGLKSFFAFLLFFSGWASLLAVIPSGGRYFTISCFPALAMICWYLHYALRDNLTKRVAFVLIPLLAIFCIVSIRVGFDMIGVATIVSNPFLAPFIDKSVPLIDFIK